MARKTYKLGLIGYGYWGPILLRNFAAHPQIRVHAVCDRNPDKLEKASVLYPGCRMLRDSGAIVNDPEIDIVAIATQAGTHFELAEQALVRGKHVFVEKPFTLDLRQAHSLIDLARDRRRTLMVDHPHIFQSDHEVVAGLLRDNRLGEVLHYHSTRADFGLFQRDTNVAWHTLYHDIYIVQDLFPGVALSEVTAHGFSHIVPGVQDAAIVSMRFQEGLTADFVVNWLFPQKERKIVIAGDRRILHWDYTAKDKVRVFRKSAKFDQATQKVAYDVLQDEEAIPCAGGESLRVEVDHLVECLDAGAQPRNGGAAAIGVMKTLLRIDDAMRQPGVAG